MTQPIHAWLESGLRRIYPRSEPHRRETLDVLAARNDRASFQVCVSNPGPLARRIQVRFERESRVEARIRRVGWVTLRHLSTETPKAEIEGADHLPGLAPDPLLPEDEVLLGPFETASFWVSLRTQPDTAPILHELALLVAEEGAQIARLRVRLFVLEPAIEPAQEFPVTHWFYADALCDWYRVAPFAEEFWPIAERYLRNAVEHGLNCLYVPLFTPPTDGVKRPTQLLGVRETEPGSYAFDFTQVRRWVCAAREAGARYLEWTHLFSQWGARHALRVYRDNADEQSLLWEPETPALSPVYRAFLAQFLPAFHAFLQEENLLDISFFHLSDEPQPEHLADYQAARELLRELAPWMRVLDALSDVRYAQMGLTDIPCASIAHAHAFADAGVEHWAYFCCGPRGAFLNRLLDTPLSKIRMSGWLLHRLGARGFLHWGYNYWYRSQTRELIDPFEDQTGGAWPGWPPGDPFVVYPGPDGPLDSLRWEVFADSLRDLALLRTLKVSLDDPRLGAIQAYDRFPSSESWIAGTRARLLGVDTGLQGPRPGVGVAG